MKAKKLEILSEKVHQVYCEQYEKDHGKPYWTNGDYSKLDEKTKEYDRAIVRLMVKYADEVSREAVKAQRIADRNHFVYMFGMNRMADHILDTKLVTDEEQEEQP